MNHLFRKHNLTLIALLLGLILTLSGGEGTVVTHAADPIIVACTDGVGDVAALIAAVDEANSDPDEDTISLRENCTYTLLTALPDPESGLPRLEADVILEGNGATIERDPDAPVFGLLHVESNAHLTANNLTLRGGSLPLEYGGAIYTMPGTSLTLNQVDLQDNEAVRGGAIYTQGETIIRDSRLGDNEAAGMGGGIYATAALTVERSDLYDNEGRMGGGAIYAAGETAVRDSRFTINYTDNTISDGGAILADGVLTVSGSHFAFNYANDGGAIYGQDVQITSSDFYENYAYDTAGGVYAVDASRGIHGVRFENNYAYNFVGGGLYVWADLDLQRSYFHANESASVGGGLYVRGEGTSVVIANNLWVDNRSEVQIANVMVMGVKTDGTISVRHNTAVHSGAIQSGSGVLISGSGVVENNILSGFGTALLAQSGLASAGSNLYFNNTTNEQGFSAPGTDNLEADPRFVGEGNYRLGEGSAAIDSAAATQTADDILGTPRPQGAQPDRGAYEFTGETETLYPVSCAGGTAGLAAAITAANRHFGPDVIEIEDGGCVFELATAAGEFGAGSSTGLPAVMDTLRLDGGGATVQRNESAAPFRLLESYAPSLTVENLTIRNGLTDGSNAHGGGIYTYYEAALHLIDVRLRDNVADDDGGGVYAQAKLAVENSELTGNWAGDYGGGIYADYGIDLRASTFVNNSADDHGGGLYLSIPESGVAVENNVWLNNQAAKKGAALYVLDYNPNFDSIRHNTITGNGTPESVALYLYSILSGGSSLRVENNIITGYAVGVMREFSGLLETNNNLYFDNAVNEFGATNSANHVKADPLFRNLAGNDARLREGSPAIDSAAALGVQVDRNGVARPQGNGSDIGAYEYVPNVPPTAAADTYTTSQDTPLEIPAPGVLGNDEDANGDPLAAVVESQPAHGELTLNINGSFTYTPTTSFSGSDSFTYRADDYADQTEPVTVTIDVLPMGTNRPPTAVPDAYTTRQDTPLEIPAPGVLDNDQDANGDALTAVLESQPAHGSLTLKANGSLTYTPAPGFSGTDRFTYRADDGRARSALATVTITVRPAGGQLQRLLLPVVVSP